MKKIVLTTLLLLMIALSACNVVQDYLPVCITESCANMSDNATGSELENTFEFTGDENDTLNEDVEVIDLDEEPATDEEDVVVDEEPATEDVKETDSEVVEAASINAIEGDLISLAELIAQDPDGDVITYTYSEPLNADGTWQTQDGDEGTYNVEVTASDGLLSTSHTIKLVIGPSNKGPVIDCPTSLTVQEGAVVELPCTIYDKEGDEVDYTVSGFADALNFETSYEDAGVKEITLVASDGNRETTHTIALTIANVNRKPTAESVEDIVALEGEEIVLEIRANDADNDALSITYPLLFNEEGTWKSEKGDAGTYELEAIVSDGDSEIVVPINILVEKVNSAPILSLAENIVVKETETIDLDISATDVDGEDLIVVIEGFMTSETYETTYDDAGEHEVTVTVSDGKAEVSKTVSITIENVNRPPVFVFK